MKSFSIFLFLVLIFQSTSAQKIWSLEDCFEHAMKNNINIKQINLTKETAQNQMTQSRMNLYMPYLNANITESFNFGISVNPATYQFVNVNTNSTQFGLNISYNLFEGLSKINTVKANKENLSATESEIEELKNNTKLSIANLYLQILLNNESLKISKENHALTLNQFNNTKALIDAGVLPSGNIFENEAQLAQNELQILTAENNLEKSLNQLKLILQLDPYEDFGIEEIKLEETYEEMATDPKMISSRSEELMPSLQSIKHRKKASEYQLKVAKGSLWPTLALSGRIGTNYFSAAQEISGVEESRNNIVIEQNGVSTASTIISSQPTFSKTAFGKQLQDNLSEGITLNLAIPILGGWQRRTAIANAKLNVIKSDLDLESKKNKLKEDIFNAYTDMRLAKKKVDASHKTIEASNAAYDYANEKFKAGIINSLEFEQARNRKISSKASLIQTKYEYFFRKVILHFYETGELKF